jgi:predicted lipid-binding transport protein (Tim44 family)
MPGRTKKGGGLEVGSAYKMKNSALHMGAKHGTPIQANYGAPTKDYSVEKGSHSHPHSPTNMGHSPAKQDGKVIGDEEALKKHMQSDAVIDKAVWFDTPGDFDVFKNKSDDAVRVYSDSKTQKSYVTPYSRISEKESRSYKPDADIVKSKHGDVVDLGSKKKRKEYHALVRKYRPDAL